uniref:Uncharacterized protein n=1 Tax=Oryza barthii TaxID=65489 RepID=A0A0D3FTX2_9ORYZ
MGNEMILSPVLHPHSRTPVPATTIVRQSAESQALHRAPPVRQPPGAPPLAAFSRTAWARALSRPSVDASSGDAIYRSLCRREPSSTRYRETLPPDKAIDAPPGAAPAADDTGSCAARSRRRHTARASIDFYQRPLPSLRATIGLPP